MNFYLGPVFIANAQARFKRRVKQERMELDIIFQIKILFLNHFYSTFQLSLSDEAERADRILIKVTLFQTYL